MKPSRLVVALLVGVLVPSAALAGLGLRALAAESERVEGRFREQAESAADATARALAQLVDEVRAGGAGAIAIHADESGVLLEPRLLRPSEAEILPLSQAQDPGLRAFLQTEIDRLQAEGDTEQAARKLRELTEREGDPGLAGWAATSLAALEDLAGREAEAREARRQLVDQFAHVRDERGLRRSFPARLEMARREADLEQLLALASEVIDDRVALEEAATGAFLRQVADAIVKLLDPMQSEEAASARRRFDDLKERERRRSFARRLVASARIGLSDWIARGAPGGARVFDLPVDPVDPESTRVLVAVEPSEKGSWKGAAMDLRELSRSALNRPETAAYAALGFATEIESDGASLGRSGEVAGEVLAARRLPPPLEELAVSAYGTDLAGFRSRERRRFALLAGLAALALSVATLAGIATVRAVSRELRAVRAREAFVAAVTHELKAPLASIRLLAEVLAQGSVEEPKVREFGARTVGEADRLRSLVDSVLESARLEQRRPQSLVPIDLHGLVREACSTFEPVARGRGFGLALRLEGPASTVMGDASSLKGALLNLLDNALKYSERPSVIEVETGADEERATVAVLDRGRGVPEQDAKRIFEPFQRIGDELTRDRPGVGLGLSLVHRIALAHGGRASHAPREGGGSRFAIELPLAPLGGGTGSRA